MSKVTYLFLSVNAHPKAANGATPSPCSGLLCIYVRYTSEETETSSRSAKGMVKVKCLPRS